MRKLIPLVMLVACSAVFAQSNEMIDKLLKQNTAAFAETCYLVLAAGNKIPETASGEEAFEYAKSKNWIPGHSESSFTVRLDELSLLLMKGLDLPGGIMYTLLGGSKYSYRELVYKGVIGGTENASRVVSGVDVMRFLQKIMELKGGAQ